MNQFRSAKNVQSSQTPSTTWIFTNSPPQLDGLESLKGWQKTAVDDSNDPSLRFNSDDVIDLNSWKYHKEVPIVDHTNKTPLSDEFDENLVAPEPKHEEELSLLGGLVG